MQYTHEAEIGRYELHKDHGNGTADFIKVEMTGKINRVRVENRVNTFNWFAMRKA